MATVTKAIGEFSGNDDENVEEWLRTVEIMCRLAQLNDGDAVRTAIFGLRGVARTWATNLLNINIQISWTNFKHEMRTRFASTKETAEVLSRFFSRGQSGSYDEYSSLLRDARMIYERGCINAEPLMKQVIARSPAEIKPVLLQAAQSGADWNNFIRCGENSGWIAFPDKIVNNVYMTSKYTPKKTEFKRKRFDNTEAMMKKFCRIHGETNHSTQECRLVKIIEEKGWSRRNNNIRRIEDCDANENLELEKVEKELNDRSAYVFSCKSYSSNNPFFIEMILFNKKIVALIDTGADVSIINCRIVPVNIKLKNADTG
ncbi:MAG: hypothetical protein ACRC1D_04765, partial [Culicoidibacterales bacterium]